MMRALVIAFLLVAGAAHAELPPGALTDPALEARARALQKELRCVVCQGESLDESGAPIAADIRKLIRDRIKAGDSDAEIKAYLVGRYGDFILMKPPLEPNTWLLWFGPATVLIVASGVAVTVILRARKRAKTA
jgi:cytochrome c-type biogenesis protein CcmH